MFDLFLLFVAACLLATIVWVLARENWWLK